MKHNPSKNHFDISQPPPKSYESYKKGTTEYMEAFYEEQKKKILPKKVSEMIESIRKIAPTFTEAKIFDMYQECNKNEKLLRERISVFQANQIQGKDDDWIEASVQRKLPQKQFGSDFYDKPSYDLNGKDQKYKQNDSKQASDLQSKLGTNVQKGYEQDDPLNVGEYVQTFRQRPNGYQETHESPHPYNDSQSYWDQQRLHNDDEEEDSHDDNYQDRGNWRGQRHFQRDDNDDNQRRTNQYRNYNYDQDGQRYQSRSNYQYWKNRNHDNNQSNEENSKRFPQRSNDNKQYQIQNKYKNEDFLESRVDFQTSQKKQINKPNEEYNKKQPLKKSLRNSTETSSNGNRNDINKELISQYDQEKIPPQVRFQPKVNAQEGQEPQKINPQPTNINQTNSILKDLMCELNISTPKTNPKVEERQVGIYAEDLEKQYYFFPNLFLRLNMMVPQQNMAQQQQDCFSIINPRQNLSQPFQDQQFPQVPLLVYHIIYPNFTQSLQQMIPMTAIQLEAHYKNLLNISIQAQQLQGKLAKEQQGQVPNLMYQYVLPNQLPSNPSSMFQLPPQQQSLQQLYQFQQQIQPFMGISQIQSGLYPQQLSNLQSLQMIQQPQDMQSNPTQDQLLQLFQGKLKN